MSIICSFCLGAGRQGLSCQRLTACRHAAQGGLRPTCCPACFRKTPLWPTASSAAALCSQGSGQKNAKVLVLTTAGGPV